MNTERAPALDDMLSDRARLAAAGAAVVLSTMAGLCARRGGPG
jgi:hypothetical protein